MPVSELTCDRETRGSRSNDYDVGARHDSLTTVRGGMWFMFSYRARL